MAKLLQNHKITGIIDAGASNGSISKRLLRLFPQASVYAFEPNPLYLPILQELAAKDSRIHPEFSVLSDKEGMIALNITRSPGSTSLFIPGKNLTEMYPEQSEIETVKHIEAVTIDDWAERKGNPSIQIMKFDIQGGELKALEGADRMLRTSTLLVYTEILFNSLYDGGAVYSEIDLSLRKRGFILYDFYKPRYHKNGKLLWADAIFVHTERLTF